MRARDTNQYYSTPSALDFATVMVFAEDPIVSGVTRIRGEHVRSCVRAVDALRTLAGLPVAWASYAPATGTVDDSHFIELRNRLNEARGVLGFLKVVFSDPVAPVQLIKGRSVRELRDGVR